MDSTVDVTIPVEPATGFTHFKFSQDIKRLSEHNGYGSIPIMAG